MLIRKPGFKVFIVNLKDFNWVIKPSWKLAPDISIDFKTVVSFKYHKFFDVFSCQKSDKISFFRAYNYHISLKKGTKLFFSPLYNISRKKNEKFCKYLFDNSDKRFIRASQSPVASPIFFYKSLEKAYNFMSTIRVLMLLQLKIDIFCFLL